MVKKMLIRVNVVEECDTTKMIVAKQLVTKTSVIFLKA